MIKKLLAIAMVASLPSLFCAEEPITNMHEATEQRIAPEDLITVCNELQKVCSTQINLGLAIVQQLIGSIQNGSINLHNIDTVIKKLTAYAHFLTQLQQQGFMAAEPAMLMSVSIIINTIIDRLTVAVDSNLTILELPTQEDLEIPYKNSERSFAYLIETIEKNDAKLQVLTTKSTELGLTRINKTLRAIENICTTYKWPLLGLSATIAGAAAYRLYQTEYGTQAYQGVKSYIANLASKEKYNGMLLGTVTFTLAQDQLRAAGTYVISSACSWLTMQYRKTKNTIAQAYSMLKGVKNIERNGFATNIDDEPMLNDEKFIGLNSQKNEFYKILDYLRNPDRFIRSNNDISKCWLLTGPSRTGKTALAKSMAATIKKLYEDMGSGLKIQFIEINEHLLQNNINVRLRELIAYAMSNAPCILFIDEIHLLALQKNGNRDLLNEFLTQLNELHKIKDPKKQVFIIAATNHPELLAPELFKHERFGKIIRFNKPGINERKEFFTRNLLKYGINPDLLDIQSLVLQTRGCDFGHLHQIIKDARFEAYNKGQGVNQDHLQNAVNSVVHGIKSSLVDLSGEELKIAALHQAGKLITHLRLGINETIHLVTVGKIEGKIEEEHYWLSEKKDTEVAPISYGGIISTSLYEEIACTDTSEIEKLCKRSLAGIVAQKIALKSNYMDYSAYDYNQAFDRAQKILLKGLSPKILSAEQRDKLFDETRKLLDRYESEVYALLENEKELIEKITEILVKQRTITGKDIDKIVQ